MIINRLLLIMMFCLAATIISAGQPDITVSQTLSQDTIWAKGSGQSPDSSTVTLTITGPSNVPRKNIDAVLVMDISNSMVGPLSTAKLASKKFIAGLDPSRDKVGFVSFNATVGPSSTLTSNFSEVAGKINGTNTNGSVNGSTCLSIGLNKAIEMLKENDSALRAIVFLSDGNNETCNSTPRDNPCIDATRAKALGIMIFAVGINDTGKGTNYLKCMTETTGGSYYSANTDKLESIYEDMGKNITNISVKDVVLKYEVSKGLEIDNMQADGFIRKSSEPNLLYGSIGTISANEIKKISFSVSSIKPGKFYLASGNNSGFTFTGYDGMKYDSKLPIREIEVQAKSVSINPDKGTNSMKEEVPVDGTPFQLQVRGSEIARIEPNTNMKVTKSITSGDFGPHITLTLTAPPIDAIRTGVVIAVDSSGSLGKGGRAEYGSNIRQSMPLILKEIKEKMSNSSVSIISWDDNIDFAYSPLSNNNPSIAALVPVSKAFEEIKEKQVFLYEPDFEKQINGSFFGKIITSLISPNPTPMPETYYFIGETESTNLSIGLESARLILDKLVHNKRDATRKLILLITARSEFSPCSKDIIDKARKEHCDIHIIGIGVIDGSDLNNELIRISGDKNKYHYSPGSWFFDNAAAATAAKEALKQFYTENISNNITIVDTLHPYLRVINQTVKINDNFIQINAPPQNPDGTTTLKINLGKNLSIKPGESVTISFDTRLDLSLPIDVTNSRTSRAFAIDQNIPVSHISYDWSGNNQTYSIPLPESNIIID